MFNLKTDPQKTGEEGEREREYLNFRCPVHTYLKCRNQHSSLKTDPHRNSSSLVSHIQVSCQTMCGDHYKL